MASVLIVKNEDFEGNKINTIDIRSAVFYVDASSFVNSLTKSLGYEAGNVWFMSSDEESFNDKNINLIRIHCTIRTVKVPINIFITDEQTGIPSLLTQVEITDEDINLGYKDFIMDEPIILGNRHICYQPDGRNGGILYSLINEGHNARRINLSTGALGTASNVMLGVSIGYIG